MDTTCSESDVGATPPLKISYAITAATNPAKQNASDHSANMAAEDSSEDSSQDAARRKKKARTTFTGRQIFELEKQFEVKKYLSSSERADMAKLLSVTETQVGITLTFLLKQSFRNTHSDLTSKNI